MAEFQAEYGKLAKKHNLPQFAELDKEFDLGNECSNFPLRDVRKKMSEKFDAMLDLLAGIVSPEHTISQLHEFKFISDAEKKRAWEIYRILMAISRESLRLGILVSEPEDAKFIVASWHEWNELKPDMVKLVEKIRDSWNEETDYEEDIGYVG